MIDQRTLQEPCCTRPTSLDVDVSGTNRLHRLIRSPTHPHPLVRCVLECREHGLPTGRQRSRWSGMRQHWTPLDYTLLLADCALHIGLACQLLPSTHALLHLSVRQLRSRSLSRAGCRPRRSATTGRHERGRYLVGCRRCGTLKCITHPIPGSNCTSPSNRKPGSCLLWPRAFPSIPHMLRTSPPAKAYFI